MTIQPQQDMKRRAILRDRKRIEGKVNEARLIARLSQQVAHTICELSTDWWCIDI